MIEDVAGPLIRKIEREPVSGFRPSADLFLGSLARSSLPCVAGLLEGEGEDGVRGLKMISDKGFDVVLQDVSIGGNPERIQAALNGNVGEHTMSVSDLSEKLLSLTRVNSGQPA